MVTETWDVLVIGGGGAGLAAAIEARELGRSVLLMEKNRSLGGSTAWAVGSISASVTPHQIRKGIRDCPRDHFLDMAKLSGNLAARDNDELRAVFCEDLPDTFRWLLDKGIRFFGPLGETPQSRPRLHAALPNSTAYIYQLERHARRSGVVIHYNSKVNELMIEEGRVTGVRVSDNQGYHEVRARGGIVLATGDFTNSPSLKIRFISDEAAKIEALNRTATGDGQIMGMRVGARVVNGDLALGPEMRFPPPARPGFLTRLPPYRALAGALAWAMNRLPLPLLRPFIMSSLTTALAPSAHLFEEGALLVSSDGSAVKGPVERIPYTIVQQPGGQAFIILDGTLAKKFSAWPHHISTAPGIGYAYLPDYRRNRRDICRKADSIEELARICGMAPAILRATIESDDAGANRRILRTGPYFALGPVRSFFVHAEGGLAVTPRLEVLGPDDHPIPGLFAAGSAGQGGLLLSGYGHHLGWAFTSGRRAGRNAAFAVTDAAREAQQEPETC
ncbi:FAD-dependent oxidoreductase [Telmatospirillum siberiense]|uniref:FAD-binding dehydrogenase n=1 Tax=Telmatospirillum siberiense TaxID=382514 RepID=A0A2N3Q1Z0_9PROT|nr:FAD-dependent oxidoreductase [Telmatospirillum siberiense]PKU26678.1 FAD-binding dehydrogenase [Telmatospirillum siberiense]